MAFVLEKISDEDRKRYNFTVPEGHIPPTKWVVDRERGVFLVRTGGVGRGEAFLYDLHWNGNIITVMVAEKSNPREKNIGAKTVYDVLFHFYEITLPKCFGSEVDAIKNIICESLSIWGHNAIPERTGHIEMAGLNDAKIKLI